MDLIVRNVKAADNQIVKTLFLRDAKGLEIAVAYSREAGFSTVMPLDRVSEDAAREILQKALDQGYEGPAKTLMEKKIE